MTTTQSPSLTFPFGKNWQSFLNSISDDALERARADIVEWVGAPRVAGSTVVDVGCGSGIHSLCFHQLGAKRVVSLDVDCECVEATQSLRNAAGNPGNWLVQHGSILDGSFVAGLGTFDIVYSWGVLHHTGHMWKAIGTAAELAAPRGMLWLALYVKGPHYAADLALKKRYNAASPLLKKMMIWQRVGHRMARLARQGRNPLRWNERKARGMDTYHDIVDWVGGFPYEVASRDETVDFLRQRGFALEKIEEHAERWNNIYLFSKA